MVNSLCILCINPTSSGTGFCLQIFWIYIPNVHVSMHKWGERIVTNLIIVLFFSGKSLAGFGVMILHWTISRDSFLSFSLPGTTHLLYNYLLHIWFVPRTLCKQQELWPSLLFLSKHGAFRLSPSSRIF